MSSKTHALPARSESRASIPQVNDPGDGFLLDGPVDSRALEILPNLLSPTQQQQNALELRAKLPWYKRPSAAWVLVGTFMAALAISSTIAPRVEIYIKLACQEIHPDYETISIHPGGLMEWPPGIGSVAIPRPSTKCKSDPAVHTAAAELGATITTIMGVLSCLTAGWWGKFCDRYGRLRVLALTTFGVLVSDIVFISVGLARDKLPLGYRFLIVAPIVEGILGGIATGSAATHAYLSDTTSPANRSGVFSLMLGLLFCGMALGPTLGGLLISQTGDILSVFYLSAGLHVAYLLLSLFVVPESLTKEAALANVEAARIKEEQNALKYAKREENMTPARKRLHQTLRTFFLLLKPVGYLGSHQSRRFQAAQLELDGCCSQLWPHCLIDGEGDSGVPGSPFSDNPVIQGSYQFKFQYASYLFGWGSQQLGYWLSVIGVMRAFHLIVILPAFIKYFGPKRQATVEGAAGAAGSSNTPANGLPPHDPAFDLVVARISLGIEICQYILVVFSTNLQLWIAATSISSFAGGFTPSMQALAVALSSQNSPVKPPGAAASSAENFGQLFGALGVIQALGSQMIGPTLFGAVFVASIETYPKAIFVTAGGIATLAMIVLSTIRLTPRSVVADAEREPLLPDRDHDE